MPDLRHKLILKKPATRWEEAFPNGNGLVGALTYGGIYDDNIVFNHHGLFLPVHSKEPLVDISGAFSEVRRLTLEGKYFEACDVWKAASTPNGYARNYGHDVDPFIPMCRLKIRNKKTLFPAESKMM